MWFNVVSLSVIPTEHMVLQGSEITILDCLADMLIGVATHITCTGIHSVPIDAGIDLTLPMDGQNGRTCYDLCGHLDEMR